MKKVVISDYEFPNLNPERDAFKDVDDYQFIDSKCTNEEELIAACRDADAVLNQWNHITARVIDAMEKCRVISTYGIGVDKIDVKEATRRGIFVCNSPEYNKFEVSNHIVMMILALSRQLIQSDRLMREGKYGWYYLDNKLFRPSNQTVGFLGFGKIARQVAEKVKAFDMKCVCYDPFLTAEQCASAGAVKLDTLEEVVKTADFVSVNVSLTDDTYHMFDRRLFALMKPTAYFINCSRGGVMDEAALVEALREKKIAGAGLDCFEIEPVAVDSPLMSLDNVIMTPHSAWHTQESMWEMQWGCARQAALVLKGEAPVHCVNYDEARKVLDARG